MHRYNGEPAENWREGMESEWREILHEIRAERYADVEVLCWDTSLVDDLIKASGEGQGDLAEGFSYEEIRNLYPDPDNWTIEQRAEWLADRGIPYDQDDRDNGLLDLIREHAEPAEVFEWWRVSEWLCGQLHEIGEVTIDNHYGYWWGRTCTGQGLLMDGTLQRVAALSD